MRSVKNPPNSDRPRVAPTFIGVALEVLLAGGLMASWIVAYYTARSFTTGVPEGTRKLTLGLWSTSDPLWPALILGIAAVLVMMTRHWCPRAAFFLVAIIVSIATWFYPLVVYNQFASSLILAVAGFWAMWKSRWPIPSAVFLLAAALFGQVRAFEINNRFEAQGAMVQAELQSINAVVSGLALAAIVIAAAALVRRFDTQQLVLAERNDELRQQREVAERAAVLDERVRISRELHDVVAHHVTTMTVHAGAARQIAAANPDGAAESLKQVERSGREAVTELHRLLGFLRSGDDARDQDRAGDERAPTPSLRHLERLGDAVPGVECDVSVIGELAQVPQSVDVSAYRIVQEALTNVMKHSTSATRVSVVVTAGADAIRLRISDDGSGAPSTAAGSGHGVLGMRERATLHGGSVEVGPSEHGWVVDARLPYQGSGLSGHAVPGGVLSNGVTRDGAPT